MITRKAQIRAGAALSGMRLFTAEGFRDYFMWRGIGSVYIITWKR